MNGYSTLHRSPDLESHHQTKCHTLDTPSAVVLLSQLDIQSVYSNPRRQGDITVYKQMNIIIEQE